MDEHLLNEKLPYYLNIYLRKPKLSRHIKLNPTNIALLLQEARQKYRKLTDYKTKSYSPLCLLRFVLSVDFLKGRAFSFLGTVLDITACRKNCVYNNFNLRYTLFSL